MKSNMGYRNSNPAILSNPTFSKYLSSPPIKKPPKVVFIIDLLKGIDSDPPWSSPFQGAAFAQRPKWQSCHFVEPNVLEVPFLSANKKTTLGGFFIGGEEGIRTLVGCKTLNRFRVGAVVTASVPLQRGSKDTDFAREVQVARYVSMD